MYICILEFIRKRGQTAGIEEPLQKRLTLLLALLWLVFIFAVAFFEFNLISFFDNGSLPLGIATGHPRFRA